MSMQSCSDPQSNSAADAKTARLQEQEDNRMGHGVLQQCPGIQPGRTSLVEESGSSKDLRSRSSNRNLNIGAPSR